MIEFLANPHNQWLITVVVQVGALVVTVIVGYFLGAADQRAVQEREDERQFRSAMQSHPMGKPSDHAAIAPVSPPPSKSKRRKKSA